MAKLKNKNKSLARENIVKILYQQDVTQYELNDICKNFIDKREYDKKYLSSTLDLIENNKAEIIGKIESNTDVKVNDTNPTHTTLIIKNIKKLIIFNFIR